MDSLGATKGPPRKVRRRNLVMGDQKDKRTLKRTGSTGIGGSSLDRLCDALLGWEFLEDLKGVERRQTLPHSNQNLSLQKPKFVDAEA